MEQVKALAPSVSARLGQVVDAVGGLRQSQAFGQGAWVAGGIVASQLLRLAGNLVLTRLLVPEAFGLMALVAAIATGVNMLCDVGIRGGVIQSKRSHSAAFMQTVWTLQLLRGVVVAGVILAVTVPVANFYDEPMLRLILPCWALNAMLLSGKSVALYLYDKKLALRRQVLVEVCTQILALIFMIVWAYISPTVWALVTGTLLASLTSLASSYLFFDGHYSRLRWDKDCVRELFGFGRWILLSTALGYLANQGDKVIMGAWLTMHELGVYAIASVMAAVATMLISTLSNRLLQPLYRRYIDEGKLTEIQKSRVAVSGVFVFGCVVLSWLGDFIIKLLYDQRYHEAGWMLQLLALRGVGISLNSTLTAYLLAGGNSYSQLQYQVLNTTVLVCGMVLGAQYGTGGIIAAYSLAPVLCHPYMVWLARAHGFRCLRADLSIIIAALVLTLLGWTVSGSLVLERFLGAF